MAGEYVLPEDALCRSQNGWGKQLYRVTVVIREGTIAQFLDAVWRQEGGLLGDGELSFVTDQPDGEETPNGRAYSGYLVFQPKPESDPAAEMN
jgi:hypothetical protein